MSSGRILAALLGAAFALLLLVIATGGPDCLEYLEWAHAAEEGDIGRVESSVRSPLGIPLTQWSHGPGLFFALPYVTPGLGAIAGDGALAPLKDFRLMGWLAALALWGGLFGLLRRVVGGDMTLTLFIIVAGFAGTHLGFYSFNHSSEVLSFGCIALIAYMLSVKRALGLFDLLGLGAAAGSLILTRPLLVIYLPLILGCIVWRLRQERVANGGRLAMWSGLAILPVLTALLQILWVNRWMTASPWHSTYNFGEGAFRSLDFARPELLATAFHPWHGLLVYHPLYALAFIVLLAGTVRAPGSERWLNLGIAVTLLLHFYLQAAWHCWWLGLWSLGNRGFGIAGLLLLPVLARAMMRARPAGRLALASGVSLCSLWSLLLMVQGHTNFHRWSELLRGQTEAAAAIAPAAAAALVAAAAAYRMARGRGMSGRRIAAGSAFLAALVLEHMARMMLERVAPSAGEGWSMALRLAFMALAPAVALLSLPPLLERSRRVPLLGPVLLLLFFCATSLFARLALRTEAVIATGGLPRGGPVATFELTEVEECLREYERVPGFQDKKSALHSFLKNQ